MAVPKLPSLPTLPDPPVLTPINQAQTWEARAGQDTVPWVPNLNRSQELGRVQIRGTKCTSAAQAWEPVLGGNRREVDAAILIAWLSKGDPQGRYSSHSPTWQVPFLRTQSAQLAVAPAGKRKGLSPLEATSYPALPTCVFSKRIVL